MNTALLTNQLIEPILGHDAVSLGVGIDAMVGARSVAVEGDSETDGFPSVAGPRTR